MGSKWREWTNELDQNSVWINGYPWMNLHQSEFPSFTPDGIMLTNLDAT